MTSMHNQQPLGRQREAGLRGLLAATKTGNCCRLVNNDGSNMAVFFFFFNQT